ncbi:MAG: sulfur carrier protein ThiS [Gemmatimonadales bacterium]|jgi:thiamine biosynthesis protein ThiS|nr:MAG: sulfur carrier protein ThiS [Gemmatimonadales bacterium]
MKEFTITLNGDRRTVPAPISLAGLLDHLGLDPRAVVVEQNRGIVRRPSLADTPVADGDVIELVHFVGGG